MVDERSRADMDAPAVSGVEPRRAGTRDPQGGPRADDAAVARSRGPLVAIGAVVLVLAGVSFIWFVNPYPPLRDALARFLHAKDETPAVQKTRLAPGTVDTTAQRAAAKSAHVADTTQLDRNQEANRDWDYYIQVSSWRQLATAQRQANALRARQIAVAVEGEFSRQQRRTVFRVRIGPFASPQHARRLYDSLKALLPEGTFIDSVRSAGQAPPPVTGPQIIQPSTAPRHDVAPAAPVRPVPGRGFGVKVSSFRSEATAQTESHRLVRQGYPAFIVRTVLADGTWYRVIVGPVRTREEADRYARAIRSSNGNEALVIEFNGSR